MSKIVKSETKELLAELGHVLWAAEHPFMPIDKNVVDLLQRCKLVLEANEQREDVG